MKYIFLIVFIFSFNCFANLTNPSFLPLGEREAFMGNAGTAGTESGGAVYFNPAGLATLTHSKISLTGSTYVAFTTSFNSLLRLDNTDLSYSATGFTSIPSSFVTAFKFRDWVIALSVLEPDFIIFDNHNNWVTPNTHTDLASVQSISEIWAGLSAARAVSSDLTLGFSLFGIKRAEAATQSLFANISSNPNTGSFTTTRINTNIYALDLTLGALYKLKRDWYLGFRGRTPYVTLSAKTDYYSSAQSLTVGVLSPSVSEQDGTNVNFQYPADFSLGVNFKGINYWSILFDLSYQLGINYKNSDVTVITKQLQSDPTLRYNFGVEYKTSTTLALRGGFFYNPSTIHDLIGKPDGTSKEDYYNVSLGLHFFSDHVDTGVGAFYLWSIGQNTIFGTGGRQSSLGTQAYGALLTTNYQF